MSHTARSFSLSFFLLLSLFLSISSRQYLTGYCREMIHLRLKNNRLFVLTYRSLVYLAPFIPLSESSTPFTALKWNAVVIFLLLFLFSLFLQSLLSLSFFFSQPQAFPEHWRPPFPASFPPRLSVTEWQREHMTVVQTADTNNIRQVPLSMDVNSTSIPRRSHVISLK